MYGFRARVLYDYDAEQPDELTIRVNDVIENVTPAEPGWFCGKLRGVVGYFPDNYVERIRGDGDSVTTVRSDVNGNVSAVDDVGRGGDEKTNKNRLYKVVFDYEPSNADELELSVGDVVQFLNEEEDGWWRGRLRDKVSLPSRS
jgi:CD2-associated protein